MQIALFSTAPGDSPALDELNRFLRGHRVLTIDRQWTGAAWVFCVTYQPPVGAAGREPPAKIDYKAVLTPEDFAVFAKLREVRKALAEKESLPAYAVLTNEQLAEIARARCATAGALEKIDGVGTARVAKYGAAILAAVAVPGAAAVTEGERR